MNGCSSSSKGTNNLRDRCGQGGLARNPRWIDRENLAITPTAFANVRPFLTILRPPIQHLTIKDVILVYQFIRERINDPIQRFRGRFISSLAEKQMDKQCQLRCKGHWYGKFACGDCVP